MSFQESTHGCATDGERGADLTLTDNIGWGPAFSWGGVLLLLAIWDPVGLGSQYGINEIPRLAVRVDKLAHVALYLVFGLLLEWGRVRTRSGFPLIFLILLGLGYGVFTECLQFFVPDRAMNLSDGLANSVGVVIGFWVGNRFLLDRYEGSSHEEV